MKLHPMFHTSLLEIYRESNFSGKIQPPPPCIEIDNDKEYEIEDILDSKIRRGQLEYSIHWHGYPISERIWEPISNLINVPLKIQEFHRQQLRKPKATLSEA